MSLLLVLAAAGAAPPAEEDLPTFEVYLQRFNKSYGPGELEVRRAVYEEAVREIAALNARPGRSWTAGVSRFTDATPEERQRRRSGGGGRRGSETPPRLRGPRAPTPPENLTAWRLRSAASGGGLPKSVSWRRVTGKIRDEAQCGGCWALATAAALDSHIFMATGVRVDVSEQAFVDCTYPAGTGNSCSSGGTREAAFEYAIEHGIASAGSYPFVSGRNGGRQGRCRLGREVQPVAGITDYVQVEPNDAEALLRAVATVGPIAVGVDATRQWDHYKGGIFDACPDHRLGLDHDVLLVGYGEEEGVKYWLVQNGWNTDWGEGGFMRIKRQDPVACTHDYMDRGRLDCGECGILSDPIYPVGAFLREHHGGGGRHGGSCASYGCGAGYSPSRSCQCNAACAAHGNCCPDYRQHCHRRRLTEGAAATVHV